MGSVRELLERAVVEPALDLLAPQWCRACGREDLAGAQAYCSRCLAEVPWIERACARCAMPASRPAEAPIGGPPVACGWCAGRPFGFDRARAAAIYEGVVRDAVVRYKFDRDRGVRAALASAVARAARASAVAWLVREADLVVAVPQHWSRTLVRGWSPAVELAEEVAARLDPTLPFRNALRKVRRTTPQVDLAVAARRGNLRGAFEVRRGVDVPATVVLVDDVLTTGSTASECARALRRAGARAVVVLTAARAR